MRKQNWKFTNSKIHPTFQFLKINSEFGKLKLERVNDIFHILKKEPRKAMRLLISS